MRVAASNRRDAGPAAETQRDPRGNENGFFLFIFLFFASGR